MERKRAIEQAGDELAGEMLALAQAHGSAGKIFHSLMGALEATRSERAEATEEDRKLGLKYTYVEAPDHPTRIAAANVLSKVLRIQPTAGANVSVALHGAGGLPGDDAIDVTAIDRLAEYESVGGNREDVLVGARALIATLEGAQGASGAAQGPAKGGQGGAKG